MSVCVCKETWDFVWESFEGRDTYGAERNYMVGLMVLWM